jgi:hypothetical protein
MKLKIAILLTFISFKIFACPDLSGNYEYEINYDYSCGPWGHGPGNQYGGRMSICHSHNVERIELHQNNCNSISLKNFKNNEQKMGFAWDFSEINESWKFLGKDSLNQEHYQRVIFETDLIRIDARQDTFLVASKTQSVWSTLLERQNDGSVVVKYCTGDINTQTTQLKCDYSHILKNVNYI